MCGSVVVRKWLAEWIGSLGDYCPEKLMTYMPAGYKLSHLFLEYSNEMVDKGIRYIFHISWDWGHVCWMGLCDYKC
jgi:hypothetical protein